MESFIVDDGVYNLINIFLKVFIISLIVSCPAIILTIEMYFYESYKKWKDTAKKDKEKIILGKANKIVKQDDEITRQSEQILKVNLELELLNIRKKSIQTELGIKEEKPELDDDAADEKIDYNSMTIIQLKDLAKNRGLKMYSKKNKKGLIKMLDQ